MISNENVPRTRTPTTCSNRRIIYEIRYTKSLYTYIYIYKVYILSVLIFFVFYNGRALKYDVYNNTVYGITEKNCEELYCRRV